MKNITITYRGASSSVAELNNQRVAQLEQQQGTQKIQYRGATSELDVNRKKQPQKRTISYRGATLETEL